MEKIRLTNEETYYLRLLVHNFDDDHILNFLKIDKERLNYIKRRLRFKFETKNWVTIIEKAFELEILNKQDFVDPVIKKIALRYTSKIVNDFKNSSNKYNLDKRLLLDFDESCNALLSEATKINLK
ncbi:hypothetical protein [Flavivirga rizhaonensis]|uniref:Uncharacterized protein n=1 Tax=Flavivirga rizhaonensis TaxID=2559571 RepID=A0A4S1E1Q0_9FLAO|nr:hypothetical protein [Flavivirga rizhaonensis]TGV04480.1 hypothetical protein EM932_02850 [Flavivirga rizhaonensis]